MSVFMRGLRVSLSEISENIKNVLIFVFNRKIEKFCFREMTQSRLHKK